MNSDLRLSGRETSLCRNV